MLCPETWRFAPPNSNYREYRRNFLYEDNKKIIPSILCDFQYTHLVSIVLPNIKEIPDGLKELLANDSDYYKVENVSLASLLNSEFIEKFIDIGELSALSINTKIDIDNCMCITPQGVLVLHLDRVSYQELGLEGTVSHFANQKKNKYIVQIRLKNLTSNKGQIERIRKCFTKRLNNFTFILMWHPPEDNICPSSVAKYFSNLGYNVFLCQPKFQIRHSKNVKVPLLSLENDSDYGYDLFEWLGMFHLDADLITGKYDNYVNTFECSDENILCNEIAFIEWKGFFTTHQIKNIYNNLKNYIQNETIPTNVPWISLYVQGFSDAPLLCKMTENHFFTNSENAYGFFIKPDGNYLLCTQMSSNKRHK